MTVKELIEKLKKEDPTREVWLEGCDCCRHASGGFMLIDDQVGSEPVIHKLLIESDS